MHNTRVLVGQGRGLCIMGFGAAVVALHIVPLADFDREFFTVQIWCIWPNTLITCA